MSEILNRLNAAGDKLIDGKAADLIDDLLGDAQGQVEKHLVGQWEGLRGPALDAVEIFRDEKVKDAAATLTKRGLSEVLGLFSAGGPSSSEAARQVYIATEATALERIEFQEQAGDDAMLLHAKREASWEALEEALSRVGKKAVKALGTLVLGKIGL